MNQLYIPVQQTEKAKSKLGRKGLLLFILNLLFKATISLKRLL